MASSSKWTQPTEQTRNIQEQLNRIDRILNGGDRPDLVKEDGYIGDRTVSAGVQLIEQLEDLQNSLKDMPGQVPITAEQIAAIIARDLGIVDIAETIHNRLSSK